MGHDNFLHGMYEMLNGDYHAAPGISKSHLDLVANSSLRHYWAKYIDPNREPDPEPTPTQIKGSALHAAILEPERFPELYLPNPGYDVKYKQGREMLAAYKAEHPGAVILSEDDYTATLKARDVVYPGSITRLAPNRRCGSGR